MKYLVNLIIFLFAACTVNAQAPLTQLKARKIEAVDSFRLAGLWISSIQTSGAANDPANKVLVTRKYLESVPGFTRDTIATIDSVLQIKFTTGQKDSLLFPSRNAGLFLASPVSTTGRPVFRRIELTDLPAGISGAQSLASVIAVNNAVSNDSINVTGNFDIVESSGGSSILSINSDSLGGYFGDRNIGDFLSWKKGDDPFHFRIHIANNATYYTPVQSGYVLTAHDELGHLSWQPPASTVKDTIQYHNSGSTVTVNTSTSWLIINPSVAITELTITLPAIAANSKSILISFGGTISAPATTVVNTLNLAPNGADGIVGSTVLYSRETTNRITLKPNFLLNKWYYQ